MVHVQNSPLMSCPICFLRRVSNKGRIRKILPLRRNAPFGQFHCSDITISLHNLIKCFPGELLPHETQNINTLTTMTLFELLGRDGYEKMLSVNLIFGQQMGTMKIKLQSK